MSDIKIKYSNNYAVLAIVDKNNEKDNVGLMFNIDCITKSEEAKWVITTKGHVTSTGIEQHIEWICKKIYGKEHVLMSLLKKKYYVSITFFSFEDSDVWSDVIGYEAIELLYKLKVPLFLNAEFRG